jgi:methanogenic corrinoid protein MtbC1
MRMLTGSNESDSGSGDAKEWIGSLSYRSEAAAPPSKTDLDRLLTQAKARNRALGVTGMLLYDSGRYFQTLEGPPEALDDVWASIRRDPRHGSIEVLSQHIVPARLFSGWDMQLYSRARDPKRLSPQIGGGIVPLADHVPLAGRHALDGDDRRLSALIGDLMAQGWVGDALITHLIEPTARALGDAWLADDCSELDLTIGLSMLQLAGHAVHAGSGVDGIRQRRYSILLASAPGEPHMLGPSLLGDMFTDAGWIVDMTFPDDDDALTREVRARRPDAVDIALSDALSRDHTLATLRETIERTRLVTANETMVISVGGRLFAEAAATALTVGADHARRTAAGTSLNIAALIDQRRRKQT